MHFSGQRKREMSQQAGGFRKARSSAATLFRTAVTACVFSITLAGSRAQVPEPPLPVDPRPLAKLLTQVELASVAEAHGHKKLVDAYLRISDTHLQAAFNLIKVNNHGACERELDVYNKAIAAAGKEAFSLDEDKRTVAKKIEQTLYRQIKTLDTIDRLFPGEREAFSDAALKGAKQLRLQALNWAFASGDVLKDPEEEKKPKSEPPVKEGPTKNESPPLAIRTHAGSHLTSAPLSDLSASPAHFKEAAPRVLASHFNRGRSSLQVPGDYLTEEEDDHVREAQAADARAKVFMKIADRRLKAIVGPTAAPTDKKDQKRVEEEEREWGALSKVSRAELLRHYARAISECMAKLEDAYERNPKSSALPKALAILRDATDKQLQTLRTLKLEMKTESEINAMSGAIDEAETANKGARDGLK
jgi:hypothetical protein